MNLVPVNVNIGFSKSATLKLGQISMSVLIATGSDPHPAEPRADHVRWTSQEKLTEVDTH